MAVTIANMYQGRMGNKRQHTFDLTFDSSYATGGESLALTSLGLGAVDSVIAYPADGMTFEYDLVNKKLKAYRPAPPIVFEETVTVTSNVGTLKYPAAYVISVSNTTTPYYVILHGLTPVTGTCTLSEPAWGSASTLTFLAGDTVTTCKVTYVTQAWKDVFDNLVHATLTAGDRVAGHADLTFGAGTPDTLDLGELAVAVQNVTWNDNGTIKACKACYSGVDPATTEVAIDFSNGTSSETRLSFREEDTVDASTDSIYVTYVKKPSAGFLNERFIEEDDLTPSSDVVTVSSGIQSNNMLLFGSCGCIPGATAKYASLIARSATIGTGATLIQPTTWGAGTNTLTLGSQHADGDHVKPSYVCGEIGEIATVPLEVPSGEDMSNVTIKVTAIGN